MMIFDYGVIAPGNDRGTALDGPALTRILSDLETQLKEGPNGGWFMGENPGRADIMMEHPVSFAKHRDWADFSKSLELSKWLERVYARDAWKRGLQKQNGMGI
jgi:glutathione S-transferase